MINVESTKEKLKLLDYEYTEVSVAAFCLRENSRKILRRILISKVVFTYAFSYINYKLISLLFRNL